MNALFFDTETTGFYQFKKPAGHPHQPYLVQLAAILVDLDTQEVLEEMDLITRPFGFEIPIQASNIHGITTAIAIEKGVPELEVLDQFQSMLDRAEKLVAHNISFDDVIMKTFYIRQEREWQPPKDQFCTMKSSTSVCRIPAPRGRAGYKWPKLMEAYQVLVDTAGFEGAHDALNDVRACRDVYFALKDREEQQQGEPT